MSFTPISVQATRLNPDGSANAGTISFTLNAEMLNGTTNVQVAPVAGVLNESGQLVAQSGLPLALFANDDDGTTPTDPTAAYVVSEDLVGYSTVQYSVIIEHTATITDTAAVFVAASNIVTLSNVRAASSMVGQTLVDSTNFPSGVAITAYDPTQNTLTLASEATSSVTEPAVISGAVDLSTLAQYAPAPTVVTYIPFTLDPAQSDGQVPTWSATDKRWEPGDGGGGGTPPFAGTSPNNSNWLEPVAWVYQSTLGFTIDPYTYDNGVDGVGATATQNTPTDGALSIDGGTPALGDRVLFYDYDGEENSSGIYTVTALGDGATIPWVLIRSTDNDTPTTLLDFWGVGVIGVGEVFPTGSQFVVNLVQTGDVGTGYVYGALGAFSTASGTGSTASGTGSTASGAFSTASGTGSTASGTGSTASGDGSTASGFNSTASGFNSTASGAFSTASGTGSTASGSYSTAYGDGQVAEATGDGQFSLASKTLGYITTSDATPTPLQNLNGQACLIRFVDTSGNPVWNKTALATLKVVGRRTDTPGTDSAWTAQGIVRGDGTSAYTWVGGDAPTFTLVGQDSDASTWAVAVSIGTDPLPSSAAAVICTVTGEADNSISWMATLELDEVAG